MPEVDTERVPQNGSQMDNCDTDSQDSIRKISDSGKVADKKKTRKRGIIYLSTIPPYMNVTKVREIFSQFGEVGRIYLQPSASKYFEVRISSTMPAVLAISTQWILINFRARRETQESPQSVHRRLGWVPEEKSG